MQNDGTFIRNNAMPSIVPVKGADMTGKLLVIKHTDEEIGMGAKDEREIINKKDFRITLTKQSFPCKNCKEHHDIRVHKNTDDPNKYAAGACNLCNCKRFIHVDET